MNYLKLEQDLLKSASNRDVKGKPFNGFFLKREDDVLISFDRTAFFSVPYNELYIDIEKVFDACEVKTLGKMLEKIKKDTEPLTYTGNTKEVTRGKRKKERLLQYKNSHGDDIFINKTLLKYYDFKRMVLYGADSRHPVVIYEDDLFVGVACPTALFMTLNSKTEAQKLIMRIWN